MQATPSQVAPASRRQRHIVILSEVVVSLREVTKQSKDLQLHLF